MDTKMVYDKARKRLHAALVMGGKSQNALARDMGQSPTTLSSKLTRDDVSVWEEIADAYAPALWIVSQLHTDLSAALQAHHAGRAAEYQERYEKEAADAMESVRNSIDEMGRLMGVNGDD